MIRFEKSQPGSLQLDHSCCSTPINKTRRRFLAISAIGLFSLNPGVNTPVIAKTQATKAIAQPKTPNDLAYIKRAFEMRDLAVKKGDQAYGAVVVKDGNIIGQSWSKVILDSDPTGHAEMSAIRDAAARKGNHALQGAVLYSSSHPCSMCEAAAHWVGINKMVFGRKAQDAGSPRLCR